MKKALGIILAIASTNTPLIADAAVNNTASGSITFLTTGFAANSMRVRTTAPFFNPEGCPIFDGYITDPSDPGTPIYHAVLLQAFESRRSVLLYISGCFSGRPKIVGVETTP